MEEECGDRIDGQIAGLATCVVGVEDEAPFVPALAQHHPHRRSAVGVGRGDGHGFGEPDERRGLIEPGGELHQRVGVRIGLGERLGMQRLRLERHSGAVRPVTAQWSTRAWESTIEVVRIPQNSNP